MIYRDIPTHTHTHGLVYECLGGLVGQWVGSGEMS